MEQLPLELLLPRVRGAYLSDILECDDPAQWAARLVAEQLALAVNHSLRPVRPDNPVFERAAE
jgi:hypothetical protein